MKIKGRLRKSGLCFEDTTYNSADHVVIAPPALFNGQTVDVVLELSLKNLPRHLIDILLKNEVEVRCANALLNLKYGIGDGK